MTRESLNDSVRIEVSAKHGWRAASGLIALLLFVATPAAAQCQFAKLTSDDASEQDQFGAGLSMSGDVVIVGVPCDDDLGLSSGAAYVFGRHEGGTNHWGQVAKLTAGDGEAGDELGFPLSISGDLVLVGARHNGETAFGAGAAYLFGRNQGGPDNWGQVAKLTAGDGAQDDIFGQSVAIAGDLAIVAALHDDDLGSNSGSAYIFARNNGGPDNWGQVVKLIAADGAATDLFGSAVAISADIAIVGARHDDDLGDDSGSAYVFARDLGGPNNWGQIAKLTGTDGAAGDDFGYSITLQGDLVAIGARHDDDLGDGSGSVYVFARNQGGPDNWGQVAKLTPDDGSVNDHFGGAVSLSGDVLVVGAPFNARAGSLSGAAYVFSRNHGGDDNWGQVAKLTSEDGAEQDQFGFPVSTDGGWVVVGAYRDDDAGTDSGSVYVFDVSGEAGTGGDCDLDGINDLCELASDPSLDLNGNGIIDSCEGALPFRRGDCNVDTVVDIADAIWALSFLFDPFVMSVDCDDACDANDDGRVDIADAIGTLSLLFGESAPPLPAPYPECGVDPTSDALGCDGECS